MANLTAFGGYEGLNAGAPMGLILYKGGNKPAGIDTTAFDRDAFETLKRNPDYIFIKASQRGEYGATTQELYARPGGIDEKTGENTEPDMYRVVNDEYVMRWAASNTRRGVFKYALKITENNILIGAENATNSDVIDFVKVNVKSYNNNPEYSVVFEVENVCAPDFSYKTFFMDYDICSIEPNYYITATSTGTPSTTVKEFTIKPLWISAESIANSDTLEVTTALGVAVAGVTFSAVGDTLTVTYPGASTLGDLLKSKALAIGQPYSLTNVEIPLGA